MLKSLAIAAATLLGLHANANQPTIMDVVTQMTHPQDAISFNVGETTDHNLKGVFNGTMHTQVREEVAEGFWVQSDMDLGFMGKQKIERLHDKDNGQVIKLLVNGQEQALPDPSGVKIVESKKDRITVPKGTFDCFYIKAKIEKNNSEQEVWLAKEVPIGGMIKTVSQTQFGEMTLELTDFHKN